MKNFFAALLLAVTLIVAFSASAQAATLSEAEAGDAALRWTSGTSSPATSRVALNDFNAFSNPWGVYHGGSSITWNFAPGTYSDPHQTASSTWWITPNHFMYWTPDGCQRIWRVRYRVRVVKDPTFTALVDSHNDTVDNQSLVQGVTKIAGSC